MKYNYTLLYQLDRFHRTQLLQFDNDMDYKQQTPQEYVINKLIKFDLKVKGSTNQYANDDGVDFIINFNNKILVFQLKYFKSNIYRNDIKKIYGQMFLNNEIIKLRNEKRNIYFNLLVPFCKCTEKEKQKFQMEKYFIISKEQFVRFLMHPHHFLMTHYNF